MIERQRPGFHNGLNEINPRRGYDRLAGRYVQMEYAGKDFKFWKLVALEDGTAVLSPFLAHDKLDDEGWIINYWSKLEGIFSLSSNLIGITPTTRTKIDRIRIIKNQHNKEKTFSEKSKN